jgi:hypothetical protein
MNTLPRKRAIRFLAALAALPLLAQSGVIGLNAYVDPLWVLPDVVGRPLLYCVKDERQNKLNRVIHGVAPYDNIVLGSSRTVRIDPDGLSGPTLNLAVAGAVPDEFTEQLRIYARHRAPPRRIYVGFDFFGYVANCTSAGLVSELRQKASASGETLHAFARVADWGTAEYAIETLGECARRAGIVQRYTYDARGVLQKPPEERLRHEQTIHDSADVIVAGYFTPAHYAPDPRFRQHLQALREAAGDAATVPFVPPVSTALFLRKMSHDRLGGYIEFLQDLIAVFGALHHFGGVNDFTRDWTNFTDAHHIRPELSSRITSVLEGRSAPSADDFGTRLTRDNIAQFAGALADAICRDSQSYPQRSMPGCTRPAAPETACVRAALRCVELGAIWGREDFDGARRRAHHCPCRDVRSADDDRAVYHHARRIVCAGVRHRPCGRHRSAVRDFDRDRRHHLATGCRPGRRALAVPRAVRQDTDRVPSLESGIAAVVLDPDQEPDGLRARGRRCSEVRRPACASAAHRAASLRSHACGHG